jgi:hypothetical protein
MAVCTHQLQHSSVAERHKRSIVCGKLPGVACGVVACVRALSLRLPSGTERQHDRSFFLRSQGASPDSNRELLFSRAETGSPELPSRWQNQKRSYSEEIVGRLFGSPRRRLQTLFGSPRRRSQILFGRPRRR